MPHGALNEDLLAHVAQFLSPHEICSIFRRLCVAWAAAGQSDAVWEVLYSSVFHVVKGQPPTGWFGLFGLQMAAFKSAVKELTDHSRLDERFEYYTLVRYAKLLPFYGLDLSKLQWCPSNCTSQVEADLYTAVDEYFDLEEGIEGFGEYKSRLGLPSELSLDVFRMFRCWKHSVPFGHGRMCWVILSPVSLLLVDEVSDEVM